MELGLKGRVAVVSGASKGIGKGIARGMAAEGVSLALLARHADQLAATAEEIRGAFGVEVLTVPTDVRDAASVKAAAAEVAARWPVVNILVNSVGAAIQRQDRAITWDDEEWRAEIEVKVTGVMRVIREFEGRLAEDGSGRIVNVTGASGVMTWMPALTYGMNNASMIHATGYLAADLASRRITVNTVVPGIVATEWREVWAEGTADTAGKSKDQWLADFCGSKGILAGRWAHVEEIADAVAFLVSDRAAYINGTKLVVDGGLSANAR